MLLLLIFHNFFEGPKLKQQLSISQLILIGTSKSPCNTYKSTLIHALIERCSFQCNQHTIGDIKIHYL